MSIFRNHPKIATSLALVVFIALALCLSLGATPYGGQNQRFEYKVISRVILTREGLNRAENRYPEAHADLVEKTLNRFGKEGWEFDEISESFLILRRQLP